MLVSGGRGHLPLTHSTEVGTAYKMVGFRAMAGGH